VTQTFATSAKKQAILPANVHRVARTTTTVAAQKDVKTRLAIIHLRAIHPIAIQAVIAMIVASIHRLVAAIDATKMATLLEIAKKHLKDVIDAISLVIWPKIARMKLKQDPATTAGNLDTCSVIVSKLALKRVINSRSPAI